MRTPVKILFAVMLMLYTHTAGSADSEGNYPKGLFGTVKIELDNKASLQRGAKYFVNYCLSCHPAQHSRYKRVADDLGISENFTKKYLIFTGQKFGDLMTVSMKREDAKKWFLGIDPPDLSTHVRAIGPQSVYEFLKTFYIDDTRPFGVNNLYLQNTAMPHVLADLQGLQKVVYRSYESHENKAQYKEFERFEQVQPGALSEEEYGQVVTDIVNFLAYLSEPAQLVRKKIGVGVLFFLAVLGVLTYFLKRNYWKDIR